MASSHPQHKPHHKKHPSRQHLPTVHIPQKAQSAKQERALKWFRTVNWKDWWEEFMTARRPDGRMVYPTAYSFARKKSKGDPEILIWTYRAIGSKLDPLQLDSKLKHERLRKGEDVPYLGDWQELRARAFFSDNDSFRRMREEVRIRLNGLEAGRGAAEAVLGVIQKFVKYDLDIDDAYLGTPVLCGLSDAKNEERAKRFYKLKERNIKSLMELIDKYLECHGITKHGMNDFSNLITAVSTGAANAALAGSATGAAQASRSEALFRLTEAIVDKSELFGRPLPEALVEAHRGPGEDEEGELQEPGGES